MCVCVCGGRSMKWELIYCQVAIREQTAEFWSCEWHANKVVGIVLVLVAGCEEM